MRTPRPVTRMALGLTLGILALSGPAQGAEHYVAPDGKPDAAGTREDPWDIVSALEGKQAVKPGDTVWLRGGKYRSQAAYEGKGPGFAVKLVGTEEEPIHVRACSGERVTIDGGMQVAKPSSYLWLWDLEITVAPDEEVSRETETAGSHPGDLGAPYGGLNIYAGEGCKYINLVVHDNFGSGVGWWSGDVQRPGGSPGGELYGCIIVNNGWKGPDRCHGHCIYAQNQEGTKTIANCIMTARWGQGQFTMHAYGSERAYVDSFVVEDNICYDRGTFLVGGGRPSRGIAVRNNYLHGLPMQIGYNAPYNEDCEIRQNIIVRGSLTVKRYKTAVVADNLIVGGKLNLEECLTVQQEQGNRVLDEGVPAGRETVLLPNKYDPHRAHLALYNRENAAQMEINVAAFLEPGEAFRLLDAEDFFGEPVLTGTRDGETIRVPMDGEFAAFVLLKD